MISCIDESKKSHVHLLCVQLAYTNTEAWLARGFGIRSYVSLQRSKRFSKLCKPLNPLLDIT